MQIYIIDDLLREIATVAFLLEKKDSLLHTIKEIHNQIEHTPKFQVKFAFKFMILHFNFLPLYIIVFKYK